MIRPRCYSLLAIAMALATTHAAAREVSADDGYETPPVQQAAAVLPAQWLNNDLYTIDDTVMNDGYLNYYRIRSEYGDFDAASTLMLRVRFREIEALAKLDEISKTAVFVNAAADAGVGQLRTIRQFATHPIHTVVGIPAGIGRMFARYKRQASDGLDTAKELVAGDDESTAGDEAADDDSAVDVVSDTATVVAEGYFGVSRAERNWHREFGTDPYSSNPVLRKAIKSVAWADRLGRFGIKSVGIPKIPGVDILGDVNEAVWSKDPYELQDLNRARLRDAGADEPLIERFFKQTTLSPTQQTLLIAAIADLEGASGRAGIVMQSLNALSETEARFFVQSTVMLAWYHRNHSPLAEISTQLTVPVGIRPAGGFTAVLAADHMYWNETIAKAVGQRMASLDNPADRLHELWTTGRVSARCREELTSLGWEIFENLTIITQPAAPAAPAKQE